MTKKNILHINNSNAISQYLISIAKKYDSSKYNLTIGCFDTFGPLNKELEKIGVNTLNIPAKNLFFYIVQLFTFARTLKKLKIDILNLHTFYPSFFGVLIGKLVGVKKIIVTRHHANQHIKLNKKIHIAIDSWTARNAHEVIAVSEYTKKILIDYEKVPAGKIKVIYNGIEPLQKNNNPNLLNNEFKIPNNCLTFLCISRIHKEKNLETAMLSISKLNKAGINCFLLIAGAGTDSEYFKEIEKFTNNQGIAEKIKFLGFRNDIGDLLCNCDALIHPSFEESFGFSVLEAMSLGKIIFGSDIPAIREVATSEVAYFFNPLDANELFDKIIYWKNNSEENVKRINKGIERYITNFTFEKMIAQYELLYEK